jgi:hypothetical protein
MAAGIDPSTWGGWERGRTVLHRKHRAAVAELLNVPIEMLDEQMAARWGGLHEHA